MKIRWFVGTFVTLDGKVVRVIFDPQSVEVRPKG